MTHSLLVHYSDSETATQYLHTLMLRLRSCLQLFERFHECYCKCSKYQQLNWVIKSAGQRNFELSWQVYWTWTVWFVRPRAPLKVRGALTELQCELVFARHHVVSVCCFRDVLGTVCSASPYSCSQLSPLLPSETVDRLNLDCLNSVRVRHTLTAQIYIVL